MSDLFTKLEQAECDVRGALERFLDDKDLYEQFYKQLLFDDNFNLLGKAIEDGLLTEAFEHAHMLKGVIGNMGLTPLFETTCDIVEPLRIGSDEGVKENYQKLLGQKDEFIKFLD